MDEKKYNNESLLGITDLMMLTGLGKRSIMEILISPGCPTWPRPKKNSPWLVPYGEFKKWFERQIERR